MTRKQSLTLFIAIIGLIVALYLLPSLSVNEANAQDASSLQNLLAKLDSRVKEGNGFTFFVALANPANPNFPEFTIGTEDGFIISEIGSDYVCFNRSAGAAITKSCLPFTNIGSIGFLEE
jgi:hypothetical protein